MSSAEVCVSNPFFYLLQLWHDTPQVYKSQKKILKYILVSLSTKWELAPLCETARMICVTVNNREYIRVHSLSTQTTAEWAESFLLLGIRSMHTHFCQSEQSCRLPASTEIAINSALKWSGRINRRVRSHDTTNCNCVWMNYRKLSLQAKELSVMKSWIRSAALPSSSGWMHLQAKWKSHPVTDIHRNNWGKVALAGWRTFCETHHSAVWWFLLRKAVLPVSGFLSILFWVCVYVCVCFWTLQMGVGVGPTGWNDMWMIRLCYASFHCQKSRAERKRLGTEIIQTHPWTLNWVLSLSYLSTLFIILWLCSSSSIAGVINSEWKYFLLYSAC